MTQKHNFLGPLIDGKVLETAIGRVLDKVAVDPNLA